MESPEKYPRCADKADKKVYYPLHKTETGHDRGKCHFVKIPVFQAETIMRRESGVSLIC